MSQLLETPSLKNTRLDNKEVHEFVPKEMIRMKSGDVMKHFDVCKSVSITFYELHMIDCSVPRMNNFFLFTDSKFLHILYSRIFD
jgi:hypothetical protein